MMIATVSAPATFRPCVECSEFCASRLHVSWGEFSEDIGTTAGHEYIIEDVCMTCAENVAERLWQLFGVGPDSGCISRWRWWLDGLMRRDPADSSKRAIAPSGFVGPIGFSPTGGVSQ